MAKRRTARKLLSLLLTLCIVLGFVPAMGAKVSAGADVFWVGSESFHSGENSTGSGFTWDCESKTLTLSGVDASKDGGDAISIVGGATVVLEGANHVTAVSGQSGLYCNGTLTIKGSGTLEVSGAEGSNGIYSAGNMTIESGYITVAVLNYGVRSGGNISVSGGYVSATATAAAPAETTDNFAAVYANADYTQTGGYVKAVGQGNDGMYCVGTITVSGGYLEAETPVAGASAVFGGNNFANSDGVVKATATGANSYGISAGGTASFTGGVTIAKTTESGIKAITAGEISGGEWYWTTTDGRVSGTGTVVNDTTAPVTAAANKYVVIAKSARSTQSTAADLDGAYICISEDEKYAWHPVYNTPAAVTGGSYLENLGTKGVIYAPDGTSGMMTVRSTGTLVAETSKSGTVLYNYYAKVTVESGGTLFAHNKSKSAGASIIDGFTNNGGNLILETINFYGLSIETLTQTGGYTCGISNGYSGIFAQTKVAVSGGYVTALRTKDQISTNVAFDASDFSVSGTGVVSAVSKRSDGFKMTSDTVPSVIATGATSKFGALGVASFDATDKTFKVSGTTARVVCLKSPPPPPDGTFKDSLGTTINNAAVLSYVSGETEHATKGYTFAGWYEKDAEGNYTGSAITSGFVSDSTYHAKWTNASGKTVVTTPLDFTDSPTLPADSGITWSGSDGKVLTLTDATIDCSGVTDCEYAINLPANAIVDITGTNTVMSGNTSAVPGEGGAYNSCAVKAAGAIDIRDNGTLDAVAGSASYQSIGIYANVTIGNGDDSPTVTATGGTIVGSITNTHSYGIQGSTIVVKSGTLTAEGSDGKFSFGIKNIESMNVTGGTVIATGGTATGSDGESYGISGSLNVTDGNVIATGNSSALNAPLTTTGTVKTNITPAPGTGTYEADDLAHYKWLKVSFTSAALSNVAVEGIKDTALSSALTATITLAGDTFKDVTVGTEFETNVTGLKAKVTAVNEEKTEATVTIYGVPTVILKNGKLMVTIPAEKLTKGAEIISSVNGDATVNIATNTIYQRTAPLNFTEGSVVYKDKFNEESTTAISADITDSGEGWAWYVDGAAVDGKTYTGKVLVLSGANIVTDVPHALNVPGGTTIVLKSGTTSNVSSTFTGSPGDSTEGVLCVGALIIDGSGTLNATGGTAKGYYDSAGILGVGLTINGGVVNGTGGASEQNSAGISAGSGELIIAGGTVNGQGGAGTAAGVGLYATDNIAVNGGSATGNGSTAAFVSETNITYPATMAITTPSGGVVGAYAIEDHNLKTVLNGATPATTATIAVKPQNTSGRGGGSAPTSTVPVIVDGEEYNIGKADTSGGVTTVTIDQTELQKQLDSASETVVIPVNPGGNAKTVAAQFVVANVDEMAEKEMTLSVQVDNVSYDMPAVAVDTSALMEELGASNPEEVPVNITITELVNEDVMLENGSLVMPPFNFTVTAGFGGRSVEVEVFQKYVQRVIEIPSDVDASRITTAVVVENGKQRHVPTEVFQKDGKWYARINSLTNSTYALINNEQSFTDTKDKWFEAVVTEMASRGIINGKGKNTFAGDASITRAEFAAILVRALGLPENGDASAFKDVAKTEWYYGAVGKAYEYDLINGRGVDRFEPNANITRQEAMAMMRRAADIAEYAGSIGTLSGFRDAGSVSSWALADAQWNVGSGLISGSNGMINGQSNITRGETATIILRLLQKSELVDVRAGV